MIDEIQKLTDELARAQTEFDAMVAPLRIRLKALQRLRAEEDAAKLGLQVGQTRKVSEQARKLQPFALDRWDVFTIESIAYAEGRTGKEYLSVTIADDTPGVSSFDADVIAVCEVTSQ